MNRNFNTRQDYKEALLSMLEPLKKYYSPGRALVQVGYTGAPYGEKTAGLEGFSRILWGLVPLWMAGEKSCLDEFIPEGIRSGTDPGHPEYWGEYHGCHQAYVEMAALGYALLAAPAHVWEPLSRDERARFADWLRQINQNEVADNNWRFFRVLVNCGLRNVGEAYSQERLEEDLARLDEFYLGDGWYSDGPTAQRDYYIAFAMHFYSLIYVAFCEKEDPGRCQRYRERARTFAADYIYWFGAKGEALPYGRSLVYRFAQAGFWCALAFVNEEAFSWGVIRGIVSRHFRWWFSQPILDAEGKLTLGYAYPNLTMCEGYNSPNSPYWAFKSFLVLALAEDHPFWTEKEEELPRLDSCRLLPHAGMLIQRGEDGYVTALTYGQYADWEPSFTAEKYEKFAYSSYFGFQTARGYNQLHLTAPDNMLAFLRDGLYHVRRKCQKTVCREDAIESVWSPMEGVTVETQISPCGKGHTRKHRIHADRPCTAVEGGFPLPVHEPEEVRAQKCDNQISISGTYGSSRIKLLEGQGKAGWLMCEPNVNVLHPRSGIPYFSYEIPQGITEICVYVEGIPANVCRDAAD